MSKLLIMTLKELEIILHTHNFIVETNGISYKFIDNTLNINNKPVTIYFLEETDKGFYFRTAHALSSSNPLLLLIDDTHLQKKITLIDEYRDSVFCTLISQ